MAAANLLEVCSFLDSELIPEEIFTSAGKFLGDELAKLQDNNYEFNNCLKLLLNYSLIERDTNNKSLSIHRLVQTVIRDLISQNEQISWLHSLVVALDNLLPHDADNPSNWHHYQIFSPTALTLLHFSKLFKIESIEAGNLSHRTGVYSFSQANYPTSLEYFEQALSIRKSVSGKDNSDVAKTLSNIGNVYLQKAIYDKALNHYQQALNIIKSTLGKKDPLFPGILNNIGEVYFNQGKYNEALQKYKEALSIYKKEKTNSILISNVYNNIAKIHTKKGEYDKSLKLSKKSLNIRIKTHGKNHPLVAQTLESIGSVFYYQKNYKKSLDHYHKALNTKKSIYGDKHPNVANTLNNIAIIYSEQKQYEQALEYLYQALDIKKSSLGTAHPDVANTIHNIGATFYCKQDYKKATEKYLEALKIRKSIFGRIHPDIAASLADLANIYGKTKAKQSKAISYYKKALDIYDKVFPSNHPQTIKLLHAYSQLLLKLNKTDEAQPLLDRLASLESSS